MPIIFIVCMGIMFTYDAFLYQRGLYVMIGGIIALYFAPKDWFQFNAFVGQQPLIRRRRKKNSRNLAVWIFNEDGFSNIIAALGVDSFAAASDGAR